MRARIVNAIGLAIVLAVVVVLVSPKVKAQAQGFMAAMLSGATNRVAVPAYLKSCLYSATTTGNTCHTGPTVLGCVVINTAGASSSTIKIYDQAGTPANAFYLQETIDATQVGRQFCYGRLIKGGLVIAHASGGAAADFTVTYQGQ